LPTPSLQNRFLAAIGSAARERWGAHLEPAELRAGEVLQNTPEGLQTVYFPESALVTLQKQHKDGCVADIALVGPEGVVGAHRVFGSDTAPDKAVVLTSGTAWQLPTDEFKRELESDSALLRLTLQYLQRLMHQMALTALCNHHHSPVQRVCRRILEVTDRLPANSAFAQALCLPGTAVAGMQSERAALTHLQAIGAIDVEADQVQVRDFASIERQGCRCYANIKANASGSQAQAKSPM